VGWHHNAATRCTVDYGFEYSDEEQQEDEDVDIENQYFNSKGKPSA
jgi:hypothetical protein